MFVYVLVSVIYILIATQKSGYGVILKVLFGNIFKSSVELCKYLCAVMNVSVCKLLSEVLFSELVVLSRNIYYLNLQIKFVLLQNL